ncbi:MAG: YwaF family protein [Firmicutes bacterium]|nr:YwaF family protein [Bacillota bacterium]
MLVLLDIVVCLILLAIPFITYEVKSRKNQIVVNRKHIILHLLVGSFFAFTYMAFRHWHTPWRAGTFLHVYALLASFAMPLALAYLCRGTDTARTVAITMAMIILLSPLSRPISVPLLREIDSVADLEPALPLNLSNISAIIFIIGIIMNSGVIKNFMITFGLFGGIMNNAMTFYVTSNTSTFWTYYIAESYFLHAFLIIIPLFMLLTGQITPRIKHVAINAAWVFVYFLFLGFLLNPLLGTNFLFTAPVYGLPNLASPITIFGSGVYLLNMLLLTILVAVAVAVSYGISWATYKYLTPWCRNEKVKDEKRD